MVKAELSYVISRYAPSCLKISHVPRALILTAQCMCVMSFLHIPHCAGESPFLSQKQKGSIFIAFSLA